MKNASTIEKKNTMLEIAAQGLSKESLKMRRLLKQPNKLDGQETKQPKKPLLLNQPTKITTTLI